MHGGCTAWLIDIATTLPIFVLQGNDRWNTSGVTTSLAVYYLAGAPLGMKLQIASHVVLQGKKTAVLEAVISERDTGKVIATAMHQKSDVPHGKLDTRKLFKL
jgi:acyl-coenzyme A thioesterase 13